MDFGGMEIGGVGVIVLVIGIVEAAKEFGVTGLWSRALAMILGLGLVGLASAMGRGVVPAEAMVWIEIVVVGLGGALAAMGLYDLARRGLAGRDGTG